jgi:hypothetical protein
MRWDLDVSFKGLLCKGIVVYWSQSLSFASQHYLLPTIIRHLSTCVRYSYLNILSVISFEFWIHKTCHLCSDSSASFSIPRGFISFFPTARRMFNKKDNVIHILLTLQMKSIFGTYIDGFLIFLTEILC